MPGNKSYEAGLMPDKCRLWIVSDSTKPASKDILGVIATDIWKEGEISGLRAVNGFEVDIKWSKGKLFGATIKSLNGESGIARFNGKDIVLNLGKGETIRLN